MATPLPITFSTLPIGLNPLSLLDQQFAAATNGAYMQDATLPASALVASGVAAGAYGDGAHVPQFTVNAEGLLTGASSIAIQISASALTGLGAGVLAWLQAPTSANLAAAVTDETGSGSLVFAISPALVAPALGTPASGIATNLTGLPPGTGLVDGTVDLPLVGNGGAGASYRKLPLTTGVTGIMPIANGGTGQATAAAALNALMPAQTGNAGKVAQTDGTNVSWQVPAGGLTPVATRTAMAGLATSLAAVYLEEAGRQGIFNWNSANLSAAVTADPQQGVNVPPTSDTTGASGAWVRQATCLDQYQFGAIGDGVSNDTTALNAWVTFCAFSGLYPFGKAGTHLVTSTFSIYVSGDFSALTINSNASTLSPTVLLGSTTVAVNYLNIKAPMVNNTAHVVGDSWVGYTSAIGLQISNLSSSYVTLNWIYGYGFGLLVGGSSHGSSYNTILMNYIVSCNTNIRLGPSNASGWANQNTFIGGTISTGAGETAPRANLELRDFGSGASIPNGNVFIDPSFEGIAASGSTVSCAGQNNLFINPRFEGTGTLFVSFTANTGTSTDSNWFMGGFGIAAVTFANSGAGTISNNGISHADTWRLSKVAPYADNTYALGDTTHRWTQLSAATATINTSDAREKDWRGPLNNAEMGVARELASHIGIYRWIEAVAKKGDAARLHIGITAQDMVQLFASHGLNAFAYGAVCRDDLPAVPELLNEDGTIRQAGVPATDRLGVRYSELFGFALAGLAAINAERDAKMDALDESVQELRARLLPAD